MATRNNFKWSINEILKLEREYELLGLSLDEIATAHKRTKCAIFFRLVQEGYLKNSDYDRLVGRDDDKVQMQKTASKEVNKIISDNRSDIPVSCQPLQNKYNELIKTMIGFRISPELYINKEEYLTLNKSLDDMAAIFDKINEQHNSIRKKKCIL